MSCQSLSFKTRFLVIFDPETNLFLGKRVDSSGDLIWKTWGDSREYNMYCIDEPFPKNMQEYIDEAFPYSFLSTEEVEKRVVFVPVLDVSDDRYDLGIVLAFDEAYR